MRSELSTVQPVSFVIPATGMPSDRLVFRRSGCPAQIRCERVTGCLRLCLGAGGCRHGCRRRYRLGAASLMLLSVMVQTTGGLASGCTVRPADGRLQDGPWQGRRASAKATFGTLGCVAEHQGKRCPSLLNYHGGAAGGDEGRGLDQPGWFGGLRHRVQRGGQGTDPYRACVRDGPAGARARARTPASDP
jgi:hypothetical protein